MKTDLFLVLTIIVALTCSCTGNRTDSSEGDALADSLADSLLTDTVDTEEELVAETPMPVSADELFADFVFNFASNGKLQLQRIAFPLKMTMPNGNKEIERKQWKTDHLFMQNDFYTLILNSNKQKALVNDTSVKTAVVERIDFTRHMIRQFFFDRQQGRWMLRSVNEQPVREHPNASFLLFYEHFATDSAFQSESIAEEVRFTGPDPDDDFSQMEGVITPDTWPAFAPLLPADVFYNIVYGPLTTVSNRAVFMIRGIANGQELEMTFLRKGAKWILTSLNT